MATNPRARPPTTTRATPPEQVEFATTHTADSTLDADLDDGLAVRFGRIDDLLGGGEPPGLVVRELEEEVAELHAISVDEPNSFAEAK